MKLKKKKCSTWTKKKNKKNCNTLLGKIWQVLPVLYFRWLRQCQQYSPVLLCPGSTGGCMSMTNAPLCSHCCQGGHRECSWWHQASCMLKTAIAEAQEGMCCQVFFLFHAMNKMPAAEIKLILLCEWELGVHSLWSCSFCRALKSDSRSWGTLSLHTPALDTGVPLNTLNISSEYPESLLTSLLVMVMPLSAPRRWGSEKSAESWPFSVIRCTEKGSAYWLYHPSVVLLTRDISANNKSRSLACQNPLFTTSSF